MASDVGTTVRGQGSGLSCPFSEHGGWVCSFWEDSGQVDVSRQ